MGVKWKKSFLALYIGNNNWIECALHIFCFKIIRYHKSAINVIWYNYRRYYHSETIFDVDSGIILVTNCHKDFIWRHRFHQICINPNMIIYEAINNPHVIRDQDYIIKNSSGRIVELCIKSSAGSRRCPI